MNWFHPLRPLFMVLVRVADEARLWKGEARPILRRLEIRALPEARR